MEEVKGLPTLFSSDEVDGRENIASDITQVLLLYFPFDL